MSKMTTEQFLSHLGIEAGKPFILGVNKLTAVVHNGNQIYVITPDGREVRNVHLNSLLDLLDCEITPLPKYTLTEEDKMFLKNVEIAFEHDEVVIERTRDTYVSVKNMNGNCILFLNNMFECIKIGEKVSLDELRKCL